jgi:hypothetical protein
MKNIAFILLLALGFSCSRSYGQVADGITYQAVALDNSGKEIAGQDNNGSIIYSKQIGVRFSILSASQNGKLLYSEAHSTYTDQFGLFSLVIGHGDVSSEGIYQKLIDIDWGTGELFLKVEIDLSNNGDFKLMGIQQMMAVPFAFHSLTTSSVTVKYSDILNKPVFSTVSTSGNYSDLNNIPIYSKVASSGDYNDLINSPLYSKVATSGNFNDLINIPVYSKVATSGNYNDLSNTPVYSKVAISGNYNDLTNRPVYSIVAISGNYNDLTNRPVYSTVATSGNYDDLKNTPAYSKVAKSGNYNDLINTPAYSTVALSGNYDDLTNKPIYSTIATTGNYNDLTNKPVIFDGNYNSLTNKPSVISEVTDEFPASVNQIVFTLTHTPSANITTKMYINGVRISNSAYSLSGVTLTYKPANNDSYALIAGDRIQFDYSY